MGAGDSESLALESARSIKPCTKIVSTTRSSMRIHCLTCKAMRLIEGHSSKSNEHGFRCGFRGVSFAFAD